MWFASVVTVVITLITYAFYKLTKNSARHFEERNLKYKGASALLNIFPVIFGKFNIFKLSQKMYNEFPDEPIYGTFSFTSPQYIVRDPETYKRIAVKDFDHFVDRRVFIDEKADELMGNTLVSMRGEKWRQMRSTLSPAFTGSKMRQMYELISECADEVVAYFSKKAKSGEKINIEMKDFFSRYANDIIATCSFGIKVNSFAEPENEFFMNGKKILSVGGLWKILIQLAKFLFQLLLPRVARAFNIKTVDVSITESFKHMILDTMTTRQQNNIHRPDMINMLMKVRQDQTADEKVEETQDGSVTVEESDLNKTTAIRKWNDNEIVAQCFLFFLAGFETTSTMLTFVAYELVSNQDVQQKLYDEIAAANEQLDGKGITYEVLQKMKYLDQVVNESLRLWPIAIQTDRDCVKDYTFDDERLKFKIDKGSNVVFSIYGMHRDAKYFPNPDKFDPERFNDENKHKILPFFAPFGIGPRNCIGSRFALMEMKAILYYLLLNFSFEVNEDTQIPLSVRRGVHMTFEKGVHLELKPRQSVI